VASATAKGGYAHVRRGEGGKKRRVSGHTPHSLWYPYGEGRGEGRLSLDFILLLRAAGRGGKKKKWLHTWTCVEGFGEWSGPPEELDPEGKEDAILNPKQRSREN